MHPQTAIDKVRATRNARQRYAVRRGVCRYCGCTDRDCSGCIERTGRPCSWVDREHTVCTACTLEGSL